MEFLVISLTKDSVFCSMLCAHCAVPSTGGFKENQTFLCFWKSLQKMWNKKTWVYSKTWVWEDLSLRLETSINPLRYGGGLIGPPFFQRPNNQKNLKCQKSEKNSIPPLISLLCTLCFNFYQSHLVFLQNTFEKTFPESRSPKGSCHILCC